MILSVSPINSLVDIFSGVNGASFISFDAVTVPVLTGGKKNPMQGKITKISKGINAMVFQNKNTNAYENMVEKRLKQEGKNPDDFVLSPRRWGERVENTPFVKHINKQGELNYYLEVICLSSGKSSYTLDNAPIDASDIIGLDKKSEGDQGGLDNKVIIRVFNINSLTKIKIDGVEYYGPFTFQIKKMVPFVTAPSLIFTE